MIIPASYRGFRDALILMHSHFLSQKPVHQVEGMNSLEQEQSTLKRRPPFAFDGWTKCHSALLPAAQGTQLVLLDQLPQFPHQGNESHDMAGRQRHAGCSSESDQDIGILRRCGKRLFDQGWDSLSDSLLGIREGHLRRRTYDQQWIWSMLNSLLQGIIVHAVVSLSQRSCAADRSRYAQQRQILSD